MITKKEVLHIAKLARIKLSKKEIEKLQKELSLILKYIEKLKEVNISKKKPFFYPALLENVVREDEEKERDEKEIEKIISLFPQKKERYLKVKAIL